MTLRLALASAFFARLVLSGAQTRIRRLFFDIGYLRFEVNAKIGKQTLHTSNPQVILDELIFESLQVLKLDFDSRSALNEALRVGYGVRAASTPADARAFPIAKAIVLEDLPSAPVPF